MPEDGGGNRKGALRQIAKRIGLGAALWIASMSVLGLVTGFTPTAERPIVAGILGAVLIVLVPFLAIGLLIYDLIRIMTDKDPAFWCKRGIKYCW